MICPACGALPAVCPVCVSNPIFATASIVSSLVFLGVSGGAAYGLSGEDEDEEVTLARKQEAKRYRAFKNFENYDWETRTGFSLGGSSFSKSRTFVSGTLSTHSLHSSFIPYATFSLLEENALQVSLGAEYFISHAMKTYAQFTHLHGYEVISLGVVFKKDIKSFSVALGVDSSYLPESMESPREDKKVEFSPFVYVNYHLPFKKVKDYLKFYTAFYPFQGMNLRTGVKLQF